MHRIAVAAVVLGALMMASAAVSSLDGHSRSRMEWYLLLMYGHGLISDADLEQFSDEPREYVRSASKTLRK